MEEKAESIVLVYSSSWYVLVLSCPVLFQGRAIPILKEGTKGAKEGTQYC